MDSIKPRILAIDDHLDNLISLQAVLGDALPGCKVLTALDGAEGLDIARVTDPDVILLDTVMPSMDGVDACLRLKADERMKDIPVIFLTALETDRESRVGVQDFGAEALLNKPWNAQELVTLVRAMVKLKAANRLRRMEKAKLEDLELTRFGGRFRYAAFFTECISSNSIGLW